MAEYEYDTDDDTNRKTLLERVTRHEREGWMLFTITESWARWEDEPSDAKPTHHYTAWLRRRKNDRNR